MDYPLRGGGYSPFPLRVFGKMIFRVGGLGKSSVDYQNILKEESNAVPAEFFVFQYLLSNTNSASSGRQSNKRDKRLQIPLSFPCKNC